MGCSGADLDISMNAQMIFACLLQRSSRRNHFRGSQAVLDWALQRKQLDRLDYSYDLKVARASDSLQRPRSERRACCYLGFSNQWPFTSSTCVVIIPLRSYMIKQPNRLKVVRMAVDFGNRKLLATELCQRFRVLKSPGAPLI